MSRTIPRTWFESGRRSSMILERLASLAASGQAHQRRFYDWDVIARRYIELFDEVERARSQAPEAAT